MRITRALTGSAAAITAVAGMGLAAAGPATAADVGGAAWRAYGNTNPITSSSSTWQCSPSKKIGVNVAAQLCVIEGSTSVNGTAAQGAVIVRNNKPVRYDAAASIQLSTPAGPISFSACGKSGVAPHTWSVCFSPGTHSGDQVLATGTANGDVLPIA